MGWKFTSWAVAQAMEKNPKFAKACVRDGHEIAAHGLRWLDIGHMEVEEEKEYMRRNCEVLKEVTGKMPRGFFYGRGTPNTRALFGDVLRGMGERALYCSESFNDDLPYCKSRFPIRSTNLGVIRANTD
jgi:peptidoglycan/xylan/chitin deacetylase (PgdA/CDA1 family)